MNISEDTRNYDQYEGIIFLVRDKIESISTIRVDAENLSIDDPVVALWSEDPTYVVLYVYLRDAVGSGSPCSSADRRAVEGMIPQV